MARYRRFRTDFHTHPKTRGLSPLARDLFVQGVESNIAGILERSLRKLASLAGGETTAAQVESAIRELERRGIARWWGDLETLWVIEAADEQAQNPKAWSAVLGVIENSPREIAASFAHRYPEKVPNSASYTVCHQEQDQEQEQDQKQEGERAQKELRLLIPIDGGASVSPPKRRLESASPQSCEIAQYLYDAIREHSPGFASGAKPKAIVSKLERWARDIDVGLRNDGMTLEGCKAAIDVAHRSADDFWRGNLLSGKKLRQHYERLLIQSAAKRNGTSDPLLTSDGVRLDEIDFHGARRELDAICGIDK